MPHAGCCQCTRLHHARVSPGRNYERDSDDYAMSISGHGWVLAGQPDASGHGASCTVPGGVVAPNLAASAYDRSESARDMSACCEEPPRASQARSLSSCPTLGVPHPEAGSHPRVAL